jgi:restriction endonuclease S subunit
MKNKIYTCEICKTKPDQLSHHKTHLETQKHKDKKELFELKLTKLNNEELIKLYNTTDINIIINENETNTFIKKLINLDSEDKYNINREMTNLEKQQIEMSQNISNKEALKDKIHEIHNYLRNNGAGYGMNALKVFNLLYGLKKIEENKLLDKVNLKRPDCEFSYLLKKANDNKDEELTELILGSVSTSIYKSNISELLFYEIPSNIKSSVFAHLIKEIDKIIIIEKTCNVLLSGKIYEYFIGRESQISELGAYFTDRHIVDYIYKKLDPEINEDGSIDTMIDMFGGSGGFTTGYINYLNDKYDNINWKDNINKIYHFDMNEDVVKSAGLEFFCLTGVLPNMNNNLKYKNSFTDEFDNKKFMNVITNPPYGGDKVIQSDAQIKRKKIKEYINKELLTLKDELKIKTRLRQIKKIEEQDKLEKIYNDKTKVSVKTCSQRIIKYAKDNNLTGNDKESSSLILIMDLVDVNGTAIGVLKEGVFFNKTYKDIRKCLVENFNVREIISVPQDQFENTSTKTSIIIFDNTKEKTTKVKFSNLVVERYTEDKFKEISNEIVLTENKDDICNISNKLISEATKNEILKNPICSLNGKDYNKKEIIIGEGYELVKLGDICEIICGKNLTKNNAISGPYKVYGGGNSSYTHNEYNNKGFNILISRVGNNDITIIDEYFFLTDNGFILKINDVNIKKYIGYYLCGNKESVLNIGNGSAQKVISKTQLNNINIPIPKSKQKISEWVNKISKPYDKKKKNKELIMKLEEQIKNKIKDIEETEDCDEINLDKICEIKSGKAINSENRTGTLYPYYAANGISGYVNEYLFDGKYIICAQDGSIGATHLVNCKFYASNHVWILKINNNINSYYIYNILKNNIDYTQITSGSVIPKLTKEKISNIKIKFPKDKKLIKDLESLFQEIEKLQIEMKEAKLQYKKIIKELSEEAILTNKQL